MAYIPTVWVDHINSGNVYNIYNNDDGTKEITFAGQALQQGTPMSAENFNHMESGIEYADKTASEAKKTASDNVLAIQTLKNNINEKTDATNSVVSSLSVSLQTAFTQISQKANSDDVYTKTETDSRITSKVSEIVAGAPEDFDTLKEMSDWLTNHEDSAAEMNSQIQTNKASIKTLQDADIEISKNIASVNSKAESALEKATENLSDITINRTTLGYRKKNLLKHTATTQTKNGITFTVNDDKSITVNGTATALSQIALYTITTNGNYILTGCPKGGSGTTYMFSMSCTKTDDTVEYVVETGNGLEINFDDTKYKKITIRLQIYKGVTVSDLRFYPMLRYADITDDTYEPYVDDVDTRLNYKLDVSSKNYPHIRYVNGKKDFNTDFQLSINDPNKVIFFNNDKAIQLNSPFASEANPYMLIVERLFSSTSVISDIRQTCIYVKSAGSEGSSYVERQREYKGHTDVWTDWKKCGQSSVEAVSEKLDRFEEQSLLYSNTTSGDSPHIVNVTGLFNGYSSVICNVVTSSSRYSLTLPLKYIKSLGTGKYYYADTLLFSYIDDDNLRIDTGLGQSNPTISSVNIIGLY